MDLGEVRRLAEEAGRVDVLVNNVGGSRYGPTADLDGPGFDALFVGNVRSAYFLVAALAPAMAVRGRGSIINMGSMAGTIGLAGAAAYGATKAAMASMARSWAAEFSPRGFGSTPSPLGRCTASRSSYVDRRGPRRRRRPHRHLAPCRGSK